MEWWRVAGIVLTVLVGLFHRQLFALLRKRAYLKGRTLKKKSTLGEWKEKGLLWGNTWLPERSSVQHFLAAGVTGSGKSLVLRRLLKTVLGRIAYGSDTRMLIYDAKSDASAFLAKAGFRGRVHSLNPFESRPIAVAWDVAADITSPTDALNLACSLIQGEEGTNRYFSDSAQLVVRAVILSLMKHSGSSWTFADLVNATTSRERLEAVLKRDKFGRDALEGFLPDNNTGHCVASTIYSNMVFYESVAAQWQRVGRKLSLKAWLKDSSVLLMGDNEAASASLVVINRAMFRFLAEQIDVQSNSDTRRTWLYADELRLAEAILTSGKLHKLVDKGRSKGFCFAGAAQCIQGIEEAVGEKLAREIIDQCANKAILRAQSKESAEWGSGLLGQYECLETFRSDSSRLGSDEGRSEQRVIKDNVLPSELYDIPVTSKENGLTGYFITAEHGAHKTWISPDKLEAVVIDEELEKSEAVVLRNEADQWLKDWTPKDMERLRLEEKTPEPQRIAAKKLRLKQAPTPIPAMSVEGRKRIAIGEAGVLEVADLPKAIADTL